MESLILEAVQWASLTDIDDTDPISDTDVQVLKEVRQVLLRHGKVDRFGVCLLHKHFEVAEDEVAIEYTDVEQRTSKVVVEKRIPTNMNSIQTTWRFSEGATTGTECIQRCAPGGTTHRIAHQTRSTRL